MTILRRLLDSAVARLDSRNVVPLAVALLVGAALGDYVTGADITFTLIYLLPIVLGSWLRGRGFGILLAAGAVAGGLFSATRALEPHQHLAATVWNQAGVLAAFVIVAWTVAALRGFVDDERRQRLLAVSQLRHAERLRVIGALAAGVAHELGTPLNIILGNAEIIGDEQVTPERVRKASETIRHQSKRMAAIIAHLLDFGRRGGSSRELTDIGALVAHSTSLLAPIATRARCHIDYERPAAPVQARVNAGEIEQVVVNLVLNAIQAMPEGGRVRLSCSRDDSRDRRGDRPTLARLTVEDRGSGIAPADLPRIFDPFFTTKGVGKGTGLGLSVSWGIIEDHGGSIDVASDLGQGSRFTVRLPLDER